MNYKTKINLDVYESTVTFHITDDMVGTVNKINKSHGIEPATNINPDTQGCATGFNYTYYIVINKNCCTYNTVAHEIYHAVEKMANGINVYEEEARAWICGYMSAKIFGFIAKNSIAIT